MTIIDLLGLHDPHIARNGFSADYLFSRRPDFIWFPHSDYTFIVTEILDNPAFTENYDYYPNAYEYGIAIRRNSRFSAEIQRILESEFSRNYAGHVLSRYKATLVERNEGQ